MDANFLNETTRILTEFAATKFSAQVLTVKGPILEGSSYHWRIVSNRFREVTVVVTTKKSMFGKGAPASIEVHGLGDTKTLKPDLHDLQDFLGTVELMAIR